MNMLYAIVCALLVVELCGCIDITTVSDQKDTVREDVRGTMLFEDDSSRAAVFRPIGRMLRTVFPGRYPGRFPNGDYIALDSSLRTLFVVSGADTSRVAIYDGGAELTVFEPKVSYDGSYVAFTYLEPGEGRFSAVVVRRNGDVVVEIPDAASPDWSPDGRLVVAASWRYPFDPDAPVQTQGADGLFVLNRELTDLTRLPITVVQPMHPSVSPDGRRVAFVRVDDIWTDNINGSDMKQVTSGAKREAYPSWSPDGASIACISSGVFDNGSYSAVATVPSDPAPAVDMRDDAPIWVRAFGERVRGVSYVTWR